jgi:hypothetical protein
MGLKSPTRIQERIVRLAFEQPDFREDLGPALSIIASEKDALSRREQLSKMMEYGGSFGVLSAHDGKDKTKNQRQRVKLIADLNMLGYRKVAPVLEGPAPHSLLVQNILPQDLFMLGNKYDQDTVLYKSADGVIGLYHLKGAPTAEVGVQPKGDPAFQIATDPSLYVRTKDMSFDFGFLSLHDASEEPTEEPKASLEWVPQEHP